VNTRTREQLLGYLLDALDEAEREQIERQLTNNPQLFHELEALQQELEPLADSYGDFEPPEDLAARTCDLVAEFAEQEEVQPAQSRLAQSMSRISPPTSRWKAADFIVVGGICCIAALLFFPAISNSRHLARLMACQNNLRQLGFALNSYSDKAGGRFFPAVPAVGQRAFAGIYAPTLFEAGYLSEPRVVLCPAAANPNDLNHFRIPTLAEIDNAPPERVAILKEQAGGSYGYSLGYMSQGRLSPTRNRQRPHFALMSDAPATCQTPIPANHGSRSYNILFEDGHVQVVQLRANGLQRDDPFRNRRGVVEAGLDENDAVIGRSTVPPLSHLGNP
jgi:prepilin-type processing-associated H-X9-DG protein